MEVNLKRESIIIILMSIMLFIVLFMAVGIYDGSIIYRFVDKNIPEKITMKTYSIIPNSTDDYIDICQSDNIEEAVECIVSTTENFLEYNLSNLRANLSFNELKEQGGVCSHWSKLYNEIGRGMDYNTYYEIIRTKENKLHAFSVFSNHQAYCILDMTHYYCIKFRRENDTNTNT